MRGRYHSAFNAPVYGPAEARAQKYWDKRKGVHPIKDGRQNFTNLSGQFGKYRDWRLRSEI